MQNFTQARYLFRFIKPQNVQQKLCKNELKTTATNFSWSNIQTQVKNKNETSLICSLWHAIHSHSHQSSRKKEKHAYYGSTIPVTWQPFKQALSHQHQVFYGLQIVYGFMKRWGSIAMWFKNQKKIKRRKINIIVVC